MERVFQRSFKLIHSSVIKHTGDENVITVTDVIYVVKTLKAGKAVRKLNMNHLNVKS